MFDTSMFGPLKLRQGAGGDYKNGLCFMEAVAWLAGENATDKPACACPQLGVLAIAINDLSVSVERQKLLAFTVEMAGTRSKEHAEARMRYMSSAINATIVEFILTYGYRLGFDIEQKLDGCARRTQKHSHETEFYFRENIHALASLIDSLTQGPNPIAVHKFFVPSFEGIPVLELAVLGEMRATHTYASDILLEKAREILQNAIHMGPNGAAEWYAYREHAESLAKFAEENLVKA